MMCMIAGPCSQKPLRISRLLSATLLSFGLLCFGISYGIAAEVTSHAKAGKRTRVFWSHSGHDNCASKGPVQGKIIGQPSHGKIWPKAGQYAIGKCPNLPGLSYYYQSSRGYKGVDAFTISVEFANGRKEVVKVNVIVE